MALSGNEKCSIIIYLKVILFKITFCTAKSLNLIELIHSFRDKLSLVWCGNSEDAGEMQWTLAM